MDFELLYWHWIVAGIALMLAEIFIGSFFIFWFGAAAVVTGLIVVLIPSQRCSPSYGLGDFVYWFCCSLVQVS
jgi:membrane-bound ClpP family serine protease